MASARALRPDSEGRNPAESRSERMQKAAAQGSCWEMVLAEMLSGVMKHRLMSEKDENAACHSAALV